MSGSSICKFHSSVLTAHKRVAIRLNITPLLQLAAAAYKKADIERSVFSNPDFGMAWQALRISVARCILSTALALDSPISSDSGTRLSYSSDISFWSLQSLGHHFFSSKISCRANESTARLPSAKPNSALFTPFVTRGTPTSTTPSWASSSSTTACD